MCRICTGDAPTESAFRQLQTQIYQVVNKYQYMSHADVPVTFVYDAMTIDELRFASGAEWGEDPISEPAQRLIFTNPDPSQGLCIFVCCCWLDMRAPYRLTWSRRLEETHAWLNGFGLMPRRNFDNTARHLPLVKRLALTPGGMSGWFADTIIDIAYQRGRTTHGNIYRFLGAVCRDLFSVGQGSVGAIKRLNAGELPDCFAGNYPKRVWMLLRFLRRDNSVIRCLFERALRTCPNGEQALSAWYDDTIFNPCECELPVDERVKLRWNAIFEMGLDHHGVALDARDLARKHCISPSALDTILFF